MPAAFLPENELSRLQSLIALDVLDTSPEDEFDAITKAAALVCNVPIALMCLVDAKRQWFKASVGLAGVSETPRGIAFCAHTIHQDGILEVEDAVDDSRFSDNPLVVADPFIRFYAGATLTLSDGSHVGTLCVLGRQPNKLNQVQRTVLSELAAAVTTALERRKALLVKHKILTEFSALSNKLLESESRFRLHSDALPIGIFSADASGGCTYTNAQWQNTFALSFDESLGNGWQARLHPDDRDYVLRTWTGNLASGREVNYQFRVKRKDDSIRTVYAIAKPLLDKQHKVVGFIGSVEDITEREKLAHANSVLLNTIRTQFIMSMTDGDGNIIEVNDAFCDISQYSREELIGSNHRIVNSGIHPHDFFKRTWMDIAHGDSWRGEICNRAKDGSLYWIDSVIAPLEDPDGNIDRYISICSDITERKHQEVDLQKSQSLLNRTGKIAGIGGWELDLATGEIYCSDEACTLYGLNHGYRPKLDEIIQFYAPDAQPLIQAAIEHAMKYGEGWDLELPFVQAGGNTILVRSVGSVELSSEGQALCVIGALQDITERVNQRLAIEEAHTRMSLATDSGQIGVWEYNLERDCLIWDAWMHRIYGLPPSEAAHNYAFWLTYLHPDERDATIAAVSASVKGAAPFDCEYRIIWPDGSLHHLRSTARVERDAHGRALNMVGVSWDVSHLRNLTAELSEQHELLRITLQSIGDAVITTDAQGMTQWLNPVAERLTGWTSEKAQGRPITHIFHIVNEESGLQTDNPVETCLQKGEIVGLESHSVLISKNGDEFGIEDSAAPIRSKQGDILGVVLVFHDVTEQRRLSGEVSYQATHDALTDLINRTEFEIRLRRLLLQTHEERSEHALMYIDLDQFKIVNDTCGHSVGDQLLQKVSALFSNEIRSRDTLARLGGDEFGVILENCSTTQAQRVAQEICDKMESFRFIHEDHRFRIGTSIGLVSINTRWVNTEEIMQAADTSCYAAKEAGRNRVHTWFDTDQAMRIRHGEMQWTTRIEQALDEDAFELYAQRIKGLKSTNGGIHAEILVRMKDVDGSMILPGAFIPAAERFHLASRIDRWVLRTAIDGLTSNAGLADKIDMLCINLSGQSIGDRSFHLQAIDMLNTAGPSMCAKICLEITETAAIVNLADASIFIEQVRLLGVRVALDDFGAGSSSFGYLKNMTVDILKIDGQFIKDLINDPLDDAAVRCFVDVANLIGLKTVAEFVDQPEVLSRVRELGIDYAQGFLLHKPEFIDFRPTHDNSHLLCV